MNAVVKQNNNNDFISLSSNSAYKHNYKLHLVKNTELFTFVDLFAGIGGLKLPFESNGGKCLITSEINDYALKTYKSNCDYGDEHKYFGDVTKISNESIPSHDLLLAGFPCQSYSIAGLRLGLSDPRGQLFLEIIRFLKNIIT